MSEGAATARQWLTRQLEELGGLFNAGVRSPIFKQWRQNTLTCIQRIWPGETPKSERFRRIPFSPPMGRPEERDVREYFAKGCGEALSLLKEYIAEIESAGVPEQSGAATASPLAGDVGAYPTVDLSDTQPAAARPAKPAIKIMKPRLKDLLGFTKDLLGFAEIPEEPAQEAAPPPPVAARPPAPRAVPPPAPRAVPPPAPVVPAEFIAPHAPGEAHPPAAPMPEFQEFHEFFEPGMRDLPAPESGPVAPIASAPPVIRQSRVVITGAAAEVPALSSVPPIPITSAAPGAALPPETAAPPDSGITIESEGLALERVTQELLSGSSHLTLVPPPAGGAVEGMTRTGRSPVALAVAALASEVDTLGVPDGQRARTRAALLDLSRNLDDPDLPWETLQDAMTFLMQTPELGRRVVPLLLPYLDRAA